MAKYRIIGNMTGNSMDAVDLVMSDFEDEKITDICSFSKPYDENMQKRMEALRTEVFNKSASEILQIKDFLPLHNEYIIQIAECINEMCRLNNIDKKTIDAIGFHGKTLDHNPPSKAKRENTAPYTLQMGSGQMLADLTGIPVVYDFRSDFVLNGFDGAPLAGPHNAHISALEGNGCYYNGGNTSNFAIIKRGKAILSTDSGPFNEYTDNFVRLHFNKAFDEDALIGKKGNLNKELLQKIFDLGRAFFETPLPKSGDPAYYHKNEIFDFADSLNIAREDIVRTFEYSSAYFAVQALTLIKEDILPQQIILFGGGWKNPLVYESFENLLNGKGYVLPEHKDSFAKMTQKKFKIKMSDFGSYMEARLFADLARYKLENKAWKIPEVISAGKKIVCGIIACPQKQKASYDDYLSRAAKK